MKRTLLALLSLALVPALVACGGGGGGSSAVSVASDPASTGGGETASALATGADSFQSGQLNGAIAKFQEVIASPAATELQRAKAYEGLGFAYLRDGSVSLAIDYLRASRASSADAGVALAGARLRQSGVVELDPAIEDLSSSVSGGPAFDAGVIETGVTEAQARAMVAVLLALRGAPGDLTLSAAHASVAREKAAGDPGAGALLATLDLLLAP